MASSEVYWGLIARSRVMAENLPDWSIRTPRVSFLVTWSSIQLPRSGITRLEEPLVAMGLDLGQVGDRELVEDPAEVLALARDDSPHGGRSGHIVALLKGRKGHVPVSGSTSAYRSSTRFPQGKFVLVA